MNKLFLPNISGQDEAAFCTAVQEGIEAADAGKLSDFKSVGDWLASWGSNDELPPPE